MCRGPRFRLADTTLRLLFVATAWFVVGNPTLIALDDNSQYADDPGLLKGLAAVATMTDQSQLARVAFTHRYLNVRAAAVAKMTDQSQLAKLAFTSRYPNVRAAAVKRLTAQTMLLKVALEDKWGDTRETAVQGLSDQTLLARVALEDSYGGARKAAIDKLTDQAVLAKAALDDTACTHLRWDLRSDCLTYGFNGVVRRVAVQRLTDQTVLAKVALEDKITTVREAAAQRLTDQTVLAKVALGDNDSAVRKGCSGEPDRRNCTGDGADRGQALYCPGQDRGEGHCSNETVASSHDSDRSSRGRSSRNRTFYHWAERCTGFGFRTFYH